MAGAALLCLTVLVFGYVVLYKVFFVG
jgi:hypothetical protein